MAKCLIHITIDELWVGEERADNPAYMQINTRMDEDCTKFGGQC